MATTSIVAISVCSSFCQFPSYNYLVRVGDYVFAIRVGHGHVRVGDSVFAVQVGHYLVRVGDSVLTVRVGHYPVRGKT